MMPLEPWMFRLGRFLGFWTSRSPRRAGDELFFLFARPRFGGGETVHAEIVRVFADKGPRVYFSAPIADPADLEPYPESIEVHCLPGAEASPYKRGFAIGRCAGHINASRRAVVFGGPGSALYEILHLLGEHVTRIDVIHAEGGDMYAAAVHAQRIDRRVVVNESLIGSLHRAYYTLDIDPDLLARIVVIDNAVAIPGPFQEPGQNETLRALFVGRGAPEKRIHLLGRVAAACDAQGLDVTIDFIGDVEPWIDPADRAACNFLGVINDRALLEQVYRDHHVLLLASHTEGFPLAVMEGMAHGLVPIAVDVGGISVHLRNGDTGYLLSAEDEESIVRSMVQHLRELSLHRENLRKLSQRVRSYAETHFSIERFREQYRRCLTSKLDPRMPLELVVSDRIGWSILIYVQRIFDLDATLTAIGGADLQDREILVLCDGPARVSIGREYMQAFRSVRILRTDQYHGFRATVVRAANWARGKYLMVLHDQLPPHSDRTRYRVAGFIAGDSSDIQAVDDMVFCSRASLLKGRMKLEAVQLHALEVLSRNSSASAVGARGAMRAVSRYAKDHCGNPECRRRLHLHGLLALRRNQPLLFRSDPVCRSLYARRLSRLCRADERTVSGVSATAVLTTCIRFDPTDTAVYGRLRSAIVGDIASLTGRSSWRSTFPRYYALDDPRLHYLTGELKEGRIYCDAAHHKAGVCLYGPDLVVESTMAMEALFGFDVSDPLGPDGVLLTCDVYDNRSDTVLAARLVTDLDISNAVTSKVVPFTARKGARLEFRVRWHGNCDLCLRALEVAPRGRSPNSSRRA